MAKNKARRNRGVVKRIAEDAISSEPGTFGTPFGKTINNAPMADQIPVNIHLAGAGSKVHEYVVGPPNDERDPLGLKRSVSDILRSTNVERTDDVDEILLDMEAKGLVKALPDGQMLVTGTRDQLMEYGIDPTDKSIFDNYVDPPTFSVRGGNPYGFLADSGPAPKGHVPASQQQIDDYMTEYSRRGYDGSDLVLVHDPDGGTPMLFPRDVLAKAQADGERLVAYTEREMKEWRKKEGEKASVRFVLDYNDDRTTTSVTKQDLDDAWLRNHREMLRAEEQIGTLDKKVATAATNLLAATEGAETAGWTLQEITQHLNVDPDRAEKIINDMLGAGHLETFPRSDGNLAFRLNEAGKQAAIAQHVFDDNDPRFMSKQWFADIHTSPQWRERIR